MTTAGTRCRHYLLNGSANGVELVITGNFLYQTAVVFEQHEVTQVVEQHLWYQSTAYQCLQLVELPQWVEVLAVDGPPVHEALKISRQRPHTGLTTVGNHQDFVVLEQVRNLLFIGLDLIKGFTQISLHICRIFQFEQHQRQPVNKQDDVRTPSVFRPLDTELIDRHPVIGLHIRPIDQANEVASGFTVLLILHGYTADQQAMEQAVSRQLHRQSQL